MLKEYLGFKSRLLFDLPFIISRGKNIKPNKLSVENKQIIKDQNQRVKEIFVLHCIDSFNFREMKPEVSMQVLTFLVTFKQIKVTMIVTTIILKEETGSRRKGNRSDDQS